MQEQASNSRKLLSSNGGGGERYGKGVRKSGHVWVRETNASEPLMRPRNRSTDGIQTGAPPLSGKSMAETWLLAMRCPGNRWRDSSLGSGMELENLSGGGKGKGTSGSPARPKVPMRRAGADCPVAARKRVMPVERRGRSFASWSTRRSDDPSKGLIQSVRRRHARHIKKIIVKPCAEKPQARFERGLMETGRR